ncbi:hypothetical protein BCON_0006g00360 [Botryotinia convoluta]|uniref:Uncharacterized protein n=1 Tax=Botryotinia convoluta TaxID=54673 RepID=A0A4Z1IVB0_9HELO|nr:hypothetical protein BCON_0006g00360 [Botryotinia convoluta]
MEVKKFGNISALDESDSKLRFFLAVFRKRTSAGAINKFDQVTSKNQRIQLVQKIKIKTANMKRTTMSCNLESSFEASRNSYNGGRGTYNGGRGNYNDPIQTDCNPSTHRDCFESCDHLERYKSFQKFIKPLHEVRYKLDCEERDLEREHERVNRLYTRSLNEFTGSSIKFSPPKRRNSIRSDCRPLHPFNLCVCCDCFLDLVAHYLESVIEMEFKQTYVYIFKIEHQELVERTLALRWEIDNNQVNADELADMLDAEDRKGKRDRIHRKRLY